MAKKNFLFRIHSIAGLISGIFILLLSISGSALVFHEELDSLQQPSIIHENGKAILSLDSCYAILQDQYPAAQVSSCNMAEDVTNPFIFSIYDPGFKNAKELMQVFMHPQTGKVLKTRGGSNDISNNFMSWLSDFHSSFRLHKTGEWLLGVFAIVFLLSIITGLVLYRKNIIAVLCFRKTSLHQLVGVYALLFNLMIGITGFWMQRYVFKKEFYKSYDYTPVIKASPPLAFRMDSSFSKIKNKFPEFTGYVIYFAQSSHGSTAIYGSNSFNSFIHSKKFADMISLDSTGNISGSRFINEVSADDRYDIVNSQIHFGKYSGWPLKVIYSLLGLTGAILSITGFILWLRRKKMIS